MADFYVRCPGCGKNYHLSDYQSDKLLCSACGREIPVLVSVKQANREEMVKLFIKAHNEKIGVYSDLIMALIVSPLIAASLFLFDISFWWKIGGVVCVIIFVVQEVKSNAIHLQVSSIFKNNRYHPEASLKAMNRYFATIRDKSDIPSEYENFSERLYNYIASNATIQKEYKKGTAQLTDTAVSSNTSPIYSGKVLTYNIPPERCPYCQALYQVADFSGRNVFCRHCGGKINLNCVVEQSEIDHCINRFVHNVSKHFRFLIKSCLIISAITLYITVKTFPETFVFEDYLFSFRIIPLLFTIVVIDAIFYAVFEYRSIKRIIKSKSKLLYIEYIVKKTNTTEWIDAFHLLKKEILALYQHKQNTMKGDLL